MSEANLLLILLGIALFSLFSGPIGRSSLTPPMAFTALGLVMSPVGFGWIDLALDNQVIRHRRRGHTDPGAVYRCCPHRSQASQIGP
ncbi:MAG: hypothetical protein KZQ81_09440 [Candidatus Thiodiazotropha sp. (ex Rostrolucina anterorostrata)]|nr:hypothetical protein [Candidatus Thiodiazotropha sp. (ex Rostrolucina anterorostrata)]